MDKILAFYPSGEYSNTLLFFDDVDQHIFEVEIFTTVR